MSRSAGMIKKQKDILVHFLEQTEELLNPKVSPSEIVSTLNALKTNAQRKCRDLHCKQTGTGGGLSKLEVLDDIEERLLALLSKIVIVGAPIPEAGVVEEVVPVAADPVLFLQVPSLDASINVHENERIPDLSSVMEWYGIPNTVMEDDVTKRK
ncbi:hypothetical protein HHI36_004979 [Cryptolaemus montrouzieri]|uniref:Uncharacterized protein n=1 Tax=Cryptolaemus montrouzieri TaxID=559131 RepID=A0ABD2NST2_9CUCU